MALSADGRLVAALGYAPGYHWAAPTDPGLPEVAEPDGVLVIAERRTGEVLFQGTVSGDEGAPVEGAMAFSPDGRRLAIGTWGGVVTVLDTGTGSVVAERRVDSAAVRGIRWSDDGAVLYQGGGDGVLRFLDPATLATRTAVPITPTVSLNAVLPVPRTRLLALAMDNGRVFFVDADRRTVVGEPLAAQSAQLLGLAASPDGTRIAGVSWDGALRLWDRRTGRAIGPPLDAHSDYTRAVAWLDDQHLLTGSFTGGLVSWDMATRDWVDRACELAGRDLTRAEWDRYLPEDPYRRTCG
jgi:WD40 repeat protein